MSDLEFASSIIEFIADIGKNHQNIPLLTEIEPFHHYFDNEGNLDIENIDRQDGGCTRREVLTRYLLVNSVLDQGPDIEGVRLLLKDVVNNLYRQEIRILHNPLDFFKDIGISIDEILKSNETVTGIRSEIWAKNNNSTANKYNLFMDNSKQVLNYAIFRWGTPLAVPLLLGKDQTNLTDYLESWDSAENMCHQLKSNQRYGLGKAIGDKATHLFAKWYVNTFSLSRRTDTGWRGISYELPLDSNVGRVLFRSGFLLQWANLSEYKSWNVIQEGGGKGGNHYIRVTNIRGKKSSIANDISDLIEKNRIVCVNFLKTKKRPRTIEIQNIPNILLLNSEYSISDLDDGLIYIGTNYCFNHAEPKCDLCPINSLCKGRNEDQNLITNYRT